MEALDGNAIAGTLHTAFGHDMTTAHGTCATCGTTTLLAELRVYLHAPGTIARCPHCDNIQLVLIETRGLICIDLNGLAALRPG